MVASTLPGRSGFQSTLSVRRATRLWMVVTVLPLFQSTLSVRRATPHHAAERETQQISIHALRKESDQYLLDSWR